jgi:hypothetical protein
MYHMVDSLYPFAKSIGKGKGIDSDLMGGTERLKNTLLKT